MITKVQIENFQTHEKTRLCCDRLTTIVGPADAGKSSVVRALRWLLTSKPRGESFVRHAANFASVKADIDNRRLTRTKNSEGNQYKLEDQSYRAFGSVLPESISDFANVSDDNFQSQHDAPFWFNLSAGEVGKRINDIVDLTVIDNSLSFVISMLRETNVELKVSEERLVDARERKDKLASVPKLVDSYNGLQDRNKELERSQAAISDLNKLIIKIGKIVRYTECELPDLRDLEKRECDLADQRDRIDQLKDLIDDCGTKMLHRKSKQERLQQVETELAAVNVCPLCESVL